MKPPLRFSRMALSLSVLAAAALAALLAAWSAVGAIETQSKSAVEHALLLGGQEWATVESDGLQVTLTGTAPDEQARFAALSAAGTQVDSSRVIDHMEVKAAQDITPPRFSIEMLRNEGGISMIGLIPAATDRDKLGERVGEIDPANPVTDLLETADYPVPELWSPALNFALTALKTLPRSKISMDATRVEVEAVADSLDQKKAWEQTLQHAVPGGVRVALNISSPRPVITPFTLRFTKDADGARFDACTAHTEAGRSKIIAAGVAAGVQGEPDCTIALGVPSPDWPQAVVRGISAVAALGGGSLTFSDADITLIAPPDTEQSVYDTVIGELENDLPDVFSLHAVKPEPKPSADGDTGAVPEFVATLGTDGQVQLKGRVTDEQERAVTVSFAGARFGVDKVHPAMRVDANLPHGWSLRTLAGLEALSHLSSGIVVVQPDVVDVTGATGDKGASAEISRVLAAKLGEAQDYRVNVQYKEELDPVASQPTPQECAAQVNAAMKDNKITFSPGSAEIEAASADTIDKIAKILKSCPDVAMEVSGYTDSQGREEMNKALSQRRADAVLSALLARRVLTTNLTAHGYGEANPIADNSTEAGREANRRIEFRLIGQPDGEGAPTDGSAADTAGGTESGAASSDTSAPPTEATAPPPRPGDTTAADTAASDSTASADATAADTTDSTDAKDAPATADAAAPETTADITAGDGTDSTAEPSTDAAAENSPAADTAPPDTTTETAAAPAADAAAADNADTPPVVVDPDLAGKRPKPRPTR